MTFSNLEDGENVVVLWADVAVTTERGHGDSVGVQHWQVVAVPPVYHSNAPVPGRKPPRENRYEGRREDYLR